MTEHEAGHVHEVEVKLRPEPSKDYRAAAVIALAQAFEAEKLENDRKQIVIEERESEIEEYKADREIHAQAFDRLQKEAQDSQTDFLTGLPNLRAFHTDVDRWSGRAARGGFRLGMMFVDIDGQKRINDNKTHGGYERGNDLIKTVGKVLEESIRGTDRVYRYGGDEFVVLLQLRDTTDINDDFLTQTRQRFTDRLDQALIAQQFPEDLLLGASAGFGVMGDSENLGQFLNRVERDMLSNKKSRRSLLEDRGVEFQDEDPRLLANH